MLSLSEIFRLTFGYVKFRASGGFCERFANLCDLRKIKVRSLSFNENSLEGFVPARDYIKLRQVAKTSGMKLSCLSKHGLPFFVFRHRNRVGLVVGAAFFVVFMSIMSLFIWSVDTGGSEKISREEILSVACEYGVKVGAFRPSIEAHETAGRIVNRLNGRLLWAAVNISGSRAFVETRDYIDKPESKTYSSPCNIVADFDGLLLSLEVHNGTKANTLGNGVKKGDLLISGIVESRTGESFFREARGVITALHTDELSLFSSEAHEYKRYLKAERVFELKAFHLKIPLGFFKKAQGEYDEFRREKTLKLNGVELPFSLTVITRAEREEMPSKSLLERQLLFDDYTRASYEKYKNTNILKTKLGVSKGEKGLVLKSESECIDYMGEKRLFKIENAQ